LIISVLTAGQICAVAQGADRSVPRSLNLQAAVEMALEHNHDVRLSSLKVEENEHAKEVARSAYLPGLTNHSTFAHTTDTEFIGIHRYTGGIFGNRG
jgi:outer membrane protein TolC